MLSFDEALRAILASVEPPEARSIPLVDSLGLVLADNVVADTDSPPFDKALMDGYAVRFADCEAGGRLAIVGEITAGRLTEKPLAAGQALRIMTGAPMPPGADTVVPFEKATELPGDMVELAAGVVRPGGNIAPQGQSIRRGQIVLPAGTQLGPVSLGALAEMGRATIPMFPAPTVSILATGDELIPFDQIPGPGQIRNSNEIMLRMQARRAGAVPIGLGVASDHPERLRDAIRRGFESDILCLSGGVSKGTKDFVPAVLSELGVEEIFHGCDIKPGKPIWFGRLPADRSDDGRPRWIFGLPGNPVSSMVCFELFTRVAIRRRLGVEPSVPAVQFAKLRRFHVSRDSRPTYFPATIRETEDGPEAEPLNWQGSFDLQSTAQANGLILFPEARTYEAGERVRIFALDGRL